MAAKERSSDLTPEARHQCGHSITPVAALPCYREAGTVPPCPETSVLDIPHAEPVRLC